MSLQDGNNNNTNVTQLQPQKSPLNNNSIINSTIAPIIPAKSTSILGPVVNSSIYFPKYTSNANNTNSTPSSSSSNQSMTTYSAPIQNSLQNQPNFPGVPSPQQHIISPRIQPTAFDHLNNFPHLKSRFGYLFRKLEQYKGLGKVGQGQYGRVYKAADNSGNVVATKKILLTENEKQGFPITAIREIMILRSLNHENIVKLLDVVSSKEGSQYLIFEFVDHDLSGLLRSNQVFQYGELKSFIIQLLKGCEEIHKKYLHRDLKCLHHLILSLLHFKSQIFLFIPKGSNVLVSSDGTLKLADFGLARELEIFFFSSKFYTQKI